MEMKAMYVRNTYGNKMAMLLPYAAPSKRNAKNWTKDVQIWKRIDASNDSKKEKRHAKKRHAYTIKTFLTLCPIFAISQISKIHH